MAKVIGVYYIRSGLHFKRKLLNCREPNISDAINKMNLSDSPRGYESSVRFKKHILLKQTFTTKYGCRNTLY